MTSKLVIRTSTLLVLRLAGMVLAAVSTVLLVRTLSSSEFGWFATLTTLTTLVNMITDRGLTQVATRLASVDHSQTRGLVRKALRIRVSIAVPAAVGCASLAAWFPAEVRWSAWLMCITVVVASLGVLAAVPLAQRRPDRVGFALSAQNLTWAVWVSFGWWNSSPLWWFAAGVLAGTIVYSLVLLTYQWNVSSRGREVADDAFHRSWAVAGGTFAWFGIVRLPVPALALLLSPAAVAPLAASLRIAEGMMLIPSSVATAVLPSVSRSSMATTGPEAARDESQLRIMVAASLLMLSVLIPASGWLVGLLGLGTSVTPVLIWVMIGVVPFAVDSVATTILIGSGRYVPLVVTGGVIAVVSLPVVMVVGVAFGLVPAAALMVASQVLRATWLVRMIGFPHAQWCWKPWGALLGAAFLLLGLAVITSPLPTPLAAVVTTGGVSAVLLVGGALAPWTWKHVRTLPLRVSQ